MIRLQHRPSRRTHRRRGAFLMIVMVCIAISAILLGALLKLALLTDRQTVYEQARLQADWLADSGIERAAYRLTHDPDYAGETWSVSPESLGGRDAASVKITVLKNEDQTAPRTVVVEAVYPIGVVHHARRTRQATVAISQEL